MTRSGRDTTAIWTAAITTVGVVVAALIQFGPDWRDTAAEPKPGSPAASDTAAMSGPDKKPEPSPEAQAARSAKFCVQDRTPLNLRSAPDLERSTILAAIPIQACDLEDATDPPTLTVEDGVRSWRNIRWGPYSGWVVDARLRPT